MRLLAALALPLAAILSGCSGGGAAVAPPMASSRRAPPVCDHRSATVAIERQGIALGTIITAWRVTNRSVVACASFGYPRLDVRADEGWLHVRVAHRHRRLQSGNVARRPVVIEPGASAYFVTEWGDVATSRGPCVEFDRVDVGLPGDVATARLRTSGCLSLGTVTVGPVASTLPSHLAPPTSADRGLASARFW